MKKSNLHKENKALRSPFITEKSHLNIPRGGFFMPLTFWAHPDMFNKADVKAIALYHFIKSRYKNSTVYDYSNNKVAKLCGISNMLVKKLIGQLIDSGMAVIHGKNLTMAATRKVLNKSYKSGWTKISINKNDSLRDICDILYLISIKEQKLQQGYVKSVKEDIKKLKKDVFIKPSRVKKLNKLKGDYKGNSYDKTIFTCRNLAKKWDVSQGTVSNILKRMADKKMIAIKKIVDNIGSYSGEVFHRVGFGHCYSYNGSLYINRGMSISIPNH